MSSNDFNFALFGEDRPQKCMIMCRDADFNQEIILEIAKEFFPELFQKKQGPFWRSDKSYKMHSSKFDQMVAWHMENHQWSEEPFVVLKLLEDQEGKLYCGTPWYVTP